MFKYSLKHKILSLLLTVICIAALCFFITGSFKHTLSQKSINMVAESVHRAAVQCYALEGAFPAELSYLQDKYGVTANAKLYFVDYQYIASNLLPNITVLPIQK